MADLIDRILRSFYHISMSSDLSEIGTHKIEIPEFYQSFHNLPKEGLFKQQYLRPIQN